MNIISQLKSSGVNRYKECIVNLLMGEKARKVIDLGCGDGVFTKEIISAGKIQADEIFGIELNSQNSRIAKSLGINVVESDLDKPFPFPDSAFDCVISSFVIEHLFDLDNFVTEIHRILKEGGTAIIGTENLGAIHNVFALLFGQQPFPMSIAISRRYCIGNIFQSNRFKVFSDNESPHCRLFAYQGLIDLFTVYGFRIEQVAGAGYIPFINKIFPKINSLYSTYILIKVRK